jgi:hypothetical protein
MNNWIENIKSVFIIANLGNHLFQLQQVCSTKVHLIGEWHLFIASSYREFNGSKEIC